MRLQPVREELEQWLAHPALDAPTSLLARQKALDFVRYVEQIARYHSPSAEVDALMRSALALRQRVKTTNARLFADVRARLRAGSTSAAEWRALFDGFTDYRPGESHPPRHIGYDGLDLLINGMLGTETVPAPQRAPEPEMVHCEPSPARVALDLVDHVALGRSDRFCDIGAGLGQIALLVHLLSGVRTRCLEFDPGYCRQMRRNFDRLNLRDISVTEGDARTAQYDGETVFYLFTPFTGRMLRTVLERLRQCAAAGPCTLCTYGTITNQVQDEPWLRAIDPRRVDSYALAIFTSQ